MRVGGAQAGDDRPQPDELANLMHEDEPRAAERIYQVAARAARLWSDCGAAGGCRGAGRRRLGQPVPTLRGGRTSSSGPVAPASKVRAVSAAAGRSGPSRGLTGPRWWRSSCPPCPRGATDRARMAAAAAHVVTSGRWLRPRVRLDGRPSDRLAVRCAAVPATVLVTAGGSVYRSRVRTLLDRAEPRRLHWTRYLSSPPSRARVACCEGALDGTEVLSGFAVWASGPGGIW